MLGLQLLLHIDDYIRGWRFSNKNTINTRLFYMRPEYFIY